MLANKQAVNISGEGSIVFHTDRNHQKVTVNGSIVTVVLNGTEILNANLDALAKAHPEHKGVLRRSGHLAFLGHGNKVAFRNIRIAEMK